MLVRKKILKTLLFLWVPVGYCQQISSFSPIDKYGDEYDLSQKMSINMQESDIKNVLMLIGELNG